MPNDLLTTPTPAPAPAPTPATTTDPAAPPAPASTDPAADPKPEVDPALDTKTNPFKAEEIKFSTEGVTVDPAVASDFVAVVNEFGIPRNAIAKLMSLQEKVMTANSEAGSRAWSEVQETWSNEVQNDPEIGGQKWPEVQGRIGQLLDTYGSPELREAFDLTGAGNNPHVVRFMSKVAQVLNESGFISANPGNNPPKSAADILYPNQGKT
jgi:hypothetical protein